VPLQLGRCSRHLLADDVADAEIRAARRRRDARSGRSQWRVADSTTAVSVNREAMRKRADLLRICGHATCFFGYVQALLSLAANGWSLTGGTEWRQGIAMNLAMFDFGLVFLRFARKIRKRAVPIPHVRRAGVMS
jgi:hypothetical protein